MNIFANETRASDGVRRISKVCTTMGAIILMYGAAASAQNEFYNAAIRVSGSDASVNLNGIPLLEDQVGDEISMGLDVGRMLKNGTNVLDVEFAPPAGFNPGTDPAPKMTVEIKKATAIAGYYRGVSISEETVDDGTLSSGTFDPEFDRVTSQQVGSDQVVEFTFVGADKYDYVPTMLQYFAADVAVSNLTVEFSDAAQTKVVTYTNIATGAAHGKIDLASMTPASGAAFLNDPGFARIKLSYTGTESFSWQSVLLQRRQEETIFKLNLPGGTTGLTEDVLSNGTQVRGSANGSTLVWEDQETRWDWAFSFAPADSFGMIPTSIMYATSNMPIGAMKIIFSNADQSHLVQYNNVVFPQTSMGATVDLSSLTPTVGAEFLMESDFNSVLFRYFTPDAELQMTNVAFVNATQTFSKSASFDVTLSQQWAWQSGQVVSSPLPGAEKQAIGAILLDLHTALDQSNITTVDSILETKARDIAKLRYGAEQDAIDGQHDFFVNALFSNPGWDMEPLNPTGLKFNVVGGGQLVHVTHTTDEYPIRSVPFDHQNNNLRFGMEPYFAKLPDGSGGFVWTIVK